MARRSATPYIGSEGHCAIQMGRKFIGAELKKSYYEQGARNLAAAHMGTQDLFSESAA